MKGNEMTETIDNKIVQKGNDILEQIHASASSKYDKENNHIAKICYSSESEENLNIKALNDTLKSLRHYINHMDTGSAMPKAKLKELYEIREELNSYSNVAFPKSKEELSSKIEHVSKHIQKINQEIHDHQQLKTYLIQAQKSLELDLKVINLGKI